MNYLDLKCNMSEKLEYIFIKHLEEKQDFRQKGRDGSVLESELYRIPIFGDKIAHKMETNRFKNIVLLASSKLRSIQTAQYIESNLKNRGLDKVLTRKDSRINPIYHGEYNVDLVDEISEKSPVAKVASKAYAIETFKNLNISYRYGDPVRNCEGSRYPDLINVFTTFGECQAEIGIRLYSFMLDLIEFTSIHKDSIICLITHSVIISRVTALSAILYEFDKGNFEYSNMQGTLFLLEWNKGFVLQKGLSYRQYFEQNEFIFDVRFRNSTQLKTLLENEIKELQTLLRF